MGASFVVRFFKLSFLYSSPDCSFSRRLILPPPLTWYLIALPSALRRTSRDFRFFLFFCRQETFLACLRWLNYVDCLSSDTSFTQLFPRFSDQPPFLEAPIPVPLQIVWRESADSFLPHLLPPSPNEIFLAFFFFLSFPLLPFFLTRENVLLFTYTSCFPFLAFRKPSNL